MLTLDEAVEQIVAVEKLPEIKGRRVGIVARGGGMGVVATDTCERAGLHVPALTKETRVELAKITPADAGSSIRNPVEIGLGRFGVSEHYSTGLILVADDPNIDVVMAIINPHVYTQEGVGAHEIDQTAQVLIDTAKTLSKPLVVVMTLGDNINVIGMELKARRKCSMPDCQPFLRRKRRFWQSVKWQNTGNSDVHSRSLFARGMMNKNNRQNNTFMESMNYCFPPKSIAVIGASTGF